MTFHRSTRLAGLGIRLFLKGIIDNNLSIAQILVVHTFNGRIRRLERIVRNEAKSLGLTGLLIPNDVRGSDDGAKGREGVVEELLIYIGWVQISNE